ncbi:hypothetical protein PMI01_03356 [Caulobacter sp. AP07]|nr:hypothetical protein PMI01_03356 [Caulobacter sp. AP07]
MTQTLNGSCYCGAVHVQLDPGRPVGELPLRVCQCGFCRRHGARYTSDPTGWLHVTAAPGALRRYRFSRQTADFLICQECACYVAAMIEDEGQAYATLNVVGTNLPGFDGREGEPLDYEDETNEQRLARRKARWTPTTLVEAVPNA